MIRPLTWVLATVLVFMLAACGASSPAPTQAPQPTAAPTRATSAAAAAATTAPVATGTRAATSGASMTPAAGATASRVASPAATATRAVGSATPGATPRATSYPLTVKDDAGRSVTLARRPQRIISLAPSNTEILFAVGLGEWIVGVDTYSNYPPAATSKPKISKYSSTDLEQVVAATPDLIFAAGITRPDVIAAFEARGFAVIVLNPADVSGVLDNLSLVGQIGDVNAEAARVRDGLETRLAALTAKLRTATTKPRVFFELDPDQYFTVGPKSFVDDLITRAGGTNIAADAGTPYPKLSPEQIILKDPEVIILSDEIAGATVAAVKARPGWSGISAVKGDRIVAIDPDLTNRPGPRIVDALETLAMALHPELFR
jgi:iron complex transport system substrate-binding protein